MSAKTPRRTFAAPLVVTLALPVAGACVVKSGTPPASSGPATNDHRTTTTSSNPPTPHTNPPRQSYPEPTVQQTPTPTPTPTQQAELRSWHVFQNTSDKSCYAALNVECPKDATCNPPPPSKLDKCPSGLTMPKGLDIREDAANSCALYYPMPDCPSGMACNPPRPQAIACPDH